MGLLDEAIAAPPRDDTLPADSLGSRSLPRRLWDRVLSLDQHTVIASLGFLILFAANFMAPTDPDYWWHLATGRLILETGAIPTQDIFSYTAAGRPWIIPEWLSEPVMYQLNATVGYAGLVAFFSAIVTAAYFVIYRLLIALQVERTLSLALMILAAVIPRAVWAPRPQIFTFLFFAITLYILFTFKESLRARLWLLPLIMVLWVNLHGGHASGLLLIGLFTAGEILNRMTRRKSAPFLPLFLTGVATTLAAIVNPHSYSLLLEPLKYATTGNASTRYITEWQSVNFHDYSSLPFALTLIGLMLLGTRGRFDFTHGLVVLAFTIMALQSQRHMILFAMAITPVLALRLRERGIRFVLEVNTGKRATPLLTVVPLILVPIFVAYVLIASPYSQARPAPNMIFYPTGGIAYLKEHKPAGNLFNTYGWGGYLIHELYPEFPVFIDGRSDFYGDELLVEYRDVVNITPRWREVLQKYQIATVLIEKESPLAVLLASQDDWRMVYEGNVERIYVRQAVP